MHTNHAGLPAPWDTQHSIDGRVSGLFDKAASHALRRLEASVKAVVIPDLQSCDAKVPLLGVVSVCVCDMVIVRLCLPPIGHGPRLTLTEAGLFQLKAQKVCGMRTSACMGRDAQAWIKAA
eukprot:364743-Chlamydomonas_euryale.AAC.71